MDRKQEVLSPLRKDQNVLQRIHIKDILDIVAFLYTRACAFPAGSCKREHAGTLDVSLIGQGNQYVLLSNKHLQVYLQFFNFSLNF
ncbi:hypothetical protein D3C73_1047750 [compost metagenome]